MSGTARPLVAADRVHLLLAPPLVHRQEHAVPRGQQRYIKADLAELYSSLSRRTAYAVGAIIVTVCACLFERKEWHGVFGTYDFVDLAIARFVVQVVYFHFIRAAIAAVFSTIKRGTVTSHGKLLSQKKFRYTIHRPIALSSEVLISKERQCCQVFDCACPHDTPTRARSLPPGCLSRSRHESLYHGGGRAGERTRKPEPGPSTVLGPP